jgi:hypothetical protein
MYSTYDITQGEVTSAVSSALPTMVGQFAGSGTGSMAVYGGWNDMSGVGVTPASEISGSNYVEATGTIVTVDVAFLYGY